MISEPMKFVVLGDGERSVGVWEVLSVQPKVNLGRVLAFLVGMGIAAALLFVPEFWVKLIAIVPAGLAILVFFGAREKGYLLLTDRRLVHYHCTTGLWQNAHVMNEVRIADISGLRAEVEKTMGLHVATLCVLSQYHDAVIVSTFASAVPILGSLPGIGRFFRDTNMGANTLEAIRDLYSKVRGVRTGARP